MLLEIELEGARQVRRAMPEATLVFLAPPSWEVLAARLAGRGTEPEDVVQATLARARVELAAASEFDVVLINEDVSGGLPAIGSIAEIHVLDFPGFPSFSGSPSFQLVPFAIA